MLGRSIGTTVALAVLLGSSAPLTGAFAQGPDTPTYPHGEFDEDCTTCHTSDRWQPAVISRDFDHGSYGFDLDGAHKGTLCRSCHLSLDFRQTATDCVSCHSDVHRGEFGADCAQCHTTSNFVDRGDEIRSHRMTRFPLTGSHLSLNCEECHALQPQGGLRFVGTAVDCVSCHLAQFQATRDPNHVAAGFDRDCTQCHTTSHWGLGNLNNFDHSATGFPLSGAHGTLDCSRCHAGNQFTGTPAQCEACHQDDFQGAAQPDHVAGGFPAACQRCHTSGTWRPAGFDHDLSGFPLTGSHAVVQCGQCHSNGAFAATPSQCASCHLDDYQQAPGHVTSAFPQTCQDCHGTVSWSTATFNHEFFPFVGGHSALDCGQCHTSGVFEDIPSACASCHLDDFQQAPGHVTSNFSQACDECHSINTWVNATFDHGIYPLSGGHGGVSCAQCHASGTYGPVSTDCSSCHLQDFQQAAGHVSSGFPQTCEECHSVTTWSNASFDHAAFALTGGHAGLPCAQCHTSGTFSPIPADCASCHLTDYQQAPGHVSSGFAQTCNDCHTVTTWANATFDHGFYALSGGHSGVQCVACHTTGTYVAISPDCVACHLDDYQQAQGHVSSNFPQTCEACHSVTIWSNATFDHGVFALTGGHSGLQCTQCHTSGVYGSILAVCSSCHQADYQQAPDHASLSFPQDCESCHTTSSWTNVAFAHSFPLRGPHDRSCTTCHTSGTTQSFTCFGVCHEHNPSEVDNEHSDVPGYVYDFQACVSCHPDGRH